MNNFISSKICFFFTSIMISGELFNVLERIDSTNNYAMRMVHDGMARHGAAWFAHEQYKGRGQREKVWKTEPGQNLILSVCIVPDDWYAENSFILSACVAVTVAQFLKTVSKKNIFIKWPNDLYINDRKAGGILIENIWMGKNWKWAVAGIGLNLNQGIFEDTIHATSVFLETGKKSDPEKEARELHQMLLKNLKDATTDWIGLYNQILFKRYQKVTFKEGNDEFAAVVNRVTESGNLLLQGYPDREFKFGELVWLLK